MFVNVWTGHTGKKEGREVIEGVKMLSRHFCRCLMALSAQIGYIVPQSFRIGRFQRGRFEYVT